MNNIQRNYIIGLITADIFKERLNGNRTDILKNNMKALMAFKDLSIDAIHEFPDNLEDNEEYGDVMTVEEWTSEGCRNICFIPEDGCGNWGIEGKYSMDHSDVFGKVPDWATHVIWYNN